MALGQKKMDDCRATFNGTNGTSLVHAPMLFFPPECVSHRRDNDGNWQIITTGWTVIDRWDCDVD